MENNKIVIGAVLGLALIAAVIYYFFYKGKDGNVTFGSIGGGQKGTPKPNTVPTTAPYVPVAITSPSDPNIVARWLQYSEMMKRIQENMNATCLRNKITADGVLGPQTLTAITNWANNTNSTQGKQIATEITRTQYITRAQADWLVKPCTSSSATATDGASTSIIASASGSVNLSNIANVDYTTLFRYIDSFSNPTNWGTESMREWAYGRLKGAPYFYCNNCAWTGYYSTANGSWVGKWENLPAGAEYTKSIGGAVFVKN